MQRVILVPGNHDIHRDTIEPAWRKSRNEPKGIPRHLIIEKGERYWYIQNQEEYDTRLENFRTFFQKIKQSEYPSKSDKQYTFETFEDLGVSFVGFNSCLLVDDERFAASVAPECIFAAANHAGTLQHPTVAVWHHDYNWRGESTGDHISRETILSLSERGFAIGLCGHTHRPGLHDAQWLEGRRLPVIAAGSLCAGKRQRGESVPRAYNIVHIRPQEGTATVFVRQKSEQTSPWEAWYRRRDGKSTDRYTIPLAKNSDPARIHNGRISPHINAISLDTTPFGELNAKDASRDKVVREYVWTPVSDLFNDDMPQIVLGPRGSGKTALLLSMTFRGRAHRFSGDPPSMFRRIGLHCSMKNSDVTSFADHHEVSEPSRRALFEGLISCIWSAELLETLQEIEAWHIEGGQETPFENGAVARELTPIWVPPGSTPKTSLRELQRSIRELRTEIALIWPRALLDSLEIPRLLASSPMFRSGPELLNETAAILRESSAFNKTKWFILFDEVEYLDNWQQAQIYRFLDHGCPGAGAKIATLPYAHVQAMKALEVPPAEGSDYQELPLTLAAVCTASGALDDDFDAPRDFRSIACSLWESRLKSFGVENPPLLSDVWPEHEWAAVLDEFAPDLLKTDPAKTLDELLIDMLTDETAQRARRVKSESEKQFSDQFSRKYQQPFRFRLSKNVEEASKGRRMPRYWGERNLLKVCDGNCRWFLQLVDFCWRRYWRTSGLRELSAEEQDAAVHEWSELASRYISNYTERGLELDRILKQMATSLGGRLHGMKMQEEMFTVRPRELGERQADAVGLGIAFGYLVPRVDGRGVGEAMKYPARNIELRMGFPVAASNDLPLRNGATASLDTLSQMSFVWRF